MPTTTLGTETRQAHGKPYFVLPLSNSLNPNDISEFEERLEPVWTSKHRYLVLDLGDIDLVSSRTVSYLENLHRELAAAEKQLALINVNEELRDTLEFVGLSKLIEVFDEEKKFLEAMHLAGI
ncbi:MAG: STAS domain-containing protein [Patescibacteria group bacterium]